MRRVSEKRASEGFDTPTEVTSDGHAFNDALNLILIRRVNSAGIVEQTRDNRVMACVCMLDIACH